MAVPNEQHKANATTSPLETRSQPSQPTISNVAVMAVWSFPRAQSRSRPAHGQRRESAGPQAVRVPDRPASRLKERLHGLSELDTSCLPHDQPISPGPAQAAGLPAQSRPTGRSAAPTPEDQPARLLRPDRPGHRHTHSSPDALSAWSAAHSIPASDRQQRTHSPSQSLPHVPAPHRPHNNGSTTAIAGHRPLPKREPSKLRSPTPLSMPLSLPVHRASIPMSRETKPIPAFHGWGSTSSIGGASSLSSLSPPNSLSASTSDLSLCRTVSAASSATGTAGQMTSFPLPHHRTNAWWKRWSKAGGKAHHASENENKQSSNPVTLQEQPVKPNSHAEPSSFKSEVYISFDDM